MANEIRGMVIAVSPIKEVASAEAGKQPMRKRSIYLNCTRHDSITGEQIGNENKPVLEFSGDRTLEKVNPILDTLQKGDVVKVLFVIRGTSYKDKEGKTKNYTGIGAYDIEVIRKAGQPVSQAQPVTQPAAQPAPAEKSPFANPEDELPF